MKKLLIILLVVIAVLDTTAQQIPLGSCGIVHIHDAAGNRTKRLYYCNNGGTYPSRPAPNQAVTADELKNAEFEEIVAIFPDPTTGVFQITFSKPLKNANIIIYDITGKVLQQKKATGSQVTCNICNLSAGEYLVKIQEGKNIVTGNVLKNSW